MPRNLKASERGSPVPTRLLRARHSHATGQL